MASPRPSATSSRRSREAPEQRREKDLIIGNFRQLEQIGQGSFAVVFKAKHMKKGTLVAVKSVFMSKLNKKLKENLGTEINILRDIRHPHIVGLFDCKEEPKFIHLVMEWCPLGDLAHFMKNRYHYAEHRDFAHIFRKYPNNKHAGLNDVLSRHFFQQLASALEFLRTRSLIHRDIKPQNLLIVPQQSYYDNPREKIPYFPSKWQTSAQVGVDSLPLLKLADFGFARWLPHTTMAETLCGSPLYMAPEILRYEKYDAKADLWSVGAVTFEMMTARPPFKAGNHIELLRKIESTQDNIKFPVDETLNEDLKGIVRELLKRNPVERISFDDFFAHKVLTDDIPGLAEEDRRKPAIQRPEIREPQAETVAGSSRQRSSSTATDKSEAQEKFHDAVDYPSKPPSRRPAMHEANTAPAGHLVQARRQSLAESPRTLPSNMQPPSSTPTQVRREAMERRASRASSKASREELQEAAREARERQELQERAAQDVAFERDYVVVEKRAVEVNSLADDMAASPRISNTARRESNPQQALLRRNTTQVASAPTSGNQVASTRAMQLAAGRKPEHVRSGSFEKRSKGSSTTSAISKAVAMASGRLLSFGLSPPMNLPLGLGRGTPSPPVYSPFPAYPTADPSLLAIGDGKDPNQPLDEDGKVRQLVEDAAHRSDVVYGFAEVKYKQLIPLAPSSEQQGLGLKGAGILAKDASASTDDDGLTVDAVVTLSEEALVLYVKALTLLAQSMNIAGSWWSKKQRGEVHEDSSSSPKIVPPTTAASTRINKVVQWVRDRFNEVLEKADFVRLKLVEAQKRLPLDHPSHPSNHSISSSAAIGTSSENVQVSPGVTAEKLMYTRALEMGRSAAVNELVGEDLQGCEISYITAIRLLEAVLDGEADSVPKKITAEDGAKQAMPNVDPDDPVDPSDRPQIINVIKGFQGRLIALRRKLRVIADRNAQAAQATKQARSPNRSPVPRHAQLASGTGSSPRS